MPDAHINEIAGRLVRAIEVLGHADGCHHDRRHDDHIDLRMGEVALDDLQVFANRSNSRICRSIEALVRGEHFLPKRCAALRAQRS